MNAFSMLLALDRRSFAVPAHQVGADRRAVLEETYALAEHDVVVQSKDRHRPKLRTRALVCTLKEDPKDDDPRGAVERLIARIGDALGVSVRAEGEEQLIGAGFCDVGGVSVLFAARPTPVGAVRISWGRNADDLAEQAKFHEASQAYARALARLMSITGRTFKLCLGTAGVAMPEDDREDGHVRIYPNAHPPGEAIARNLREVYGLPIALNAPEIAANGPAIGRGIVLKDEAKVPVVQVLGRHVFVLFPILTNFNALTSVRIFDRAIAAALEAMGSPEAAGPEADPTPERLAEAATPWIAEWAESLDKASEQYRTEIRQFQEAIAIKQRFLRETEATAASVRDSAFVKRAKERLPDEFRTILALEGVASAAFVENGIQVVTGDLQIAWNGRRFAIGPLRVRVNALAKVTVWSEAPRHPDGIPHPHVDDFTSPCFGNAGERVAKLLADHRYGDAFAVIMSWLVRGYTHELARHKIEEWPEIAEDGSVIPVETVVIDSLAAELAGQEGIHA
ncbi:MAG TPA: hypothetical protein VL283_02120 [Candidatus Baltobacteraceae bacterium]|nr:hypothetical protein [Candidatus Baltobacteraceae bacterium]